jgi:hypothetical protein
MMSAFEMSDEEFVRAFESCELSPDAFHHRDHIRLAAIYVSRHGAAEATERFRTSLRRFATHIGKSDKYHETITIAWIQLVAHAMTTKPGTAPGDFPELLDKNYIGKFYSPGLLATESARTDFVEPDRTPLPVIGLPPTKTGADRTRVVK